MMKTIFQVLLNLAVILGAYYYGGLSVLMIVVIVVTTPIVGPYLQKIVFPGTVKEKDNSSE